MTGLGATPKKPLLLSSPDAASLLLLRLTVARIWAIHWLISSPPSSRVLNVSLGLVDCFAQSRSAALSALPELLERRALAKRARFCRPLACEELSLPAASAWLERSPAVVPTLPLRAVRPGVRISPLWKLWTKMLPCIE